MSKEAAMPDVTVGHVEDPRHVVDDQEDSGKVHLKSYLLVAGVNMVYFAQIVNLIGAAALSRNIAAVIGGESDIIWFSQIITIVATVVQPPSSQAADYWGRKWALIFFTMMGCVGSIIVSRATSVGVAFVGFIFSGLAFAAQPMVPTISSEVLPRRIRPYAQAFVNAAGSGGACSALLFGGALVNNGHNEGFRIHFYISAGVYALAAAIVAVLYNPPKRVEQVELTFWQKFLKLDWPAYTLLSIGVVLFCIGLSWSNNPYPWSNAHVSAPFAVGVFFLGLLAIYAWKIRKDGIVNHRLFQHRNFAIAEGLLFVEGLCFISYNNYIPAEAALVFPSNAIEVNLHLVIVLGGGILISLLGAAYSSYTKTVRPVSAAAFLCFLIYYICAATITTNTSPTAFWIYPIFAGGGIGLCITTLMTGVQFAAPLELISTTTGISLAVRALGGSIGLAIFEAVFNHGIASKLAPNIADAVLPLGFPAKSLGVLIEAVTSSDPEALAAVPGVTPTIAQAARQGLRATYAVAFRYIWIVGACFAFVALVGCIFLVDPKSSYNKHVDAPVEAEMLERQHHKHEATPEA